jgi:hypothetical protein
MSAPVTPASLAADRAAHIAEILAQPWVPTEPDEEFIARFWAGPSGLGAFTQARRAKAQAAAARTGDAA